MILRCFRQAETTSYAKYQGNSVPKVQKYQKNISFGNVRDYSVVVNLLANVC